MPRIDLNPAGGAYTDDAKPWSIQDTCNWIPATAERPGTRSSAQLKTPPGLYPFVEKDGTGTVRGLHNAEERLIAVMGNTMYRITNSGVAIPLGTIPGVGRVVIDHNQISLGNQIMAVNGSAGYIYNTVTDVFERITDDGFPGGSVVKFIDGYFVVADPQGRFAQSSSPADGLEWNTLDRFTSEVKPDRLVSLAVVGNELMLLSAASCEFFQSTANSEQPFRSRRIAIDKGCAGAYVVAEADNSVFWLGNDGMFYQLQGYAAVRISTRAIEQAIRGLNWSQAYAHMWEDEGHTVIYWTFPDGRTWGYDVSEREWHRRESYEMNRWRVSATTYWRNSWIAGDFQNMRLWTLDWNYPWEGSTEFESYRVTGVVHADQRRVVHDRLEVVMDTGMPYVEPVAFPDQPDPPVIEGDAPNGSLGLEYEYTYTLSGGTPPYFVSLRPGGALPDGLSLSSAGVITGTPTVEGDFSWTVRLRDSTGLYDDLDDGASVGAGFWVLTGADVATVYVSGSPVDWTGALELERAPSIDPDDSGVGGGGYYWLGEDRAFMVNSDGEVEVLNSLTLTDPMVPAVTTPFGSAAWRVRIFGGTIFVFNATGAASYYTSTDNGATWNTRATPALTIADIGKVGARWVAYVQSGPSHDYYYSDDATEPSSWTVGTGPWGSLTQGAMLSLGDKAMRHCGSGGIMASTTDGATWTASGDIVPNDGDLSCYAFDGDQTIVAGGPNSAFLWRSTDKGVSWTSVAFRNTYRIDYYNGTWIACCPGASGGIFYSTDGGATWAASTLPAGVTPAFYTALYASPLRYPA